MLDTDGVGELTIDEFVSGLAYLQEGLSTKHIVDVEYSVKKVSHRTEQRLEKIKRFMADMKSLNQDVHASLRGQEIADNEQLRALWLWKEWAEERSPGCFDSYPEVLARIRKPCDPADVLDQTPCPRPSLRPDLQAEGYMPLDGQPAPFGGSSGSSEPTGCGTKAGGASEESVTG